MSIPLLFSSLIHRSDRTTSVGVPYRPDPVFALRHGQARVCGAGKRQVLENQEEPFARWNAIQYNGIQYTRNHWVWMYPPALNPSSVYWVNSGHPSPKRLRSLPTTSRRPVPHRVTCANQAMFLSVQLLRLQSIFLHSESKLFFKL